MNCCGGVEEGVHYSETDTKPPPYIRRCFKSRSDAGETVYQWSGFPCSNKNSKDCCNEGGTSIGDCIPTTKGGFCKDSTGSDKVFYKHKSKSNPYMKRGNDNILDINDVIDMKDYYYSRREDSTKKSMSPDMQRFMARRSKNEKYMEQHIINKGKKTVMADQAKRDSLETQKKYEQVVKSITIIHLLALVVISVTIRHALVARIQIVLNAAEKLYREFSGKPT